MNNTIKLSCLFLGLTLTAVNSSHAMTWNFNLTNDLFHNQQGGLESGTRLMSKATLGANGAIDKSIEWRTSLHATGNGGFSEELAGDSFTASNIDGPEGARIDEAWLKGRKSQWGWLIGSYDLNSEFDHIVPAELFINSAHGIGPDFSQSGHNGPSIFPFTALAARAEWQINSKNLVRTALIDGVPGTPHSTRYNNIYLNKNEGILFVAEWQTINTNNSFCTLGAWRYSDQFSTLSADKEAPAFGLYTSFAQSASLDHLGTWIRLGWANRSVHEMKHHLSAGVSTMRAMGDREIEYGAAIAQGTSSSYLSEGINIESKMKLL